MHASDARGPTDGPRQAPRGFSLIETAIATALLGVGVTALVVAARSGTQVNAAGSELTQATYLVQEIREWTLKLPFIDPDPGDQDNPPGPDGTSPQVFVDDLDDLTGVVYCPPRDGCGLAISDMENWSQTINITWRDPDNLVGVVEPGSTDTVFVEVLVHYNDRYALGAGWLVTRRASE